MKRAFAIVSGICLLASAGHAAETPQKSRLWGKQSSDLALMAMHNFGSCVVDRSRRGAEMLLGLEPGTAAYHEKLNALAKGNNYCSARSEIAFNGQLFVGALAERLITTRVPSGEFASAAAFNPAKPALQAHDALDYMGMCLVRKKPDAVDALLRSHPASPAEQAAMEQMSGSLPGCLRDGQEVHLNKPGLRSVIAVAAYRIVANNQAEAPLGEGR